MNILKIFEKYLDIKFHKNALSHRVYIFSKQTKKTTL